MLSFFSFGDKMYEYTVYAKISNREFELKTFFDSDGEPEKKAKTLIENNKNKFRSMRIEKRLVGLL
jgi:ABC-type lipoprotein release transport system permease subunit